MRTLKIARTEKGLSQQELSRLTSINQGTISALEREVVGPTNNQRMLLDKALGHIDWPVDRPFSNVEKYELVQAFAVVVNLRGPRAAVELFAKTKTLDELRGMASLFTPPTHFEEPLGLPDSACNGDDR